MLPLLEIQNRLQRKMSLLDEWTTEGIVWFGLLLIGVLGVGFGLVSLFGFFGKSIGRVVSLEIMLVGLMVTMVFCAVAPFRAKRWYIAPKGTRCMKGLSGGGRTENVGALRHREKFMVIQGGRR